MKLFNLIFGRACCLCRVKLPPTAEPTPLLCPACAQEIARNGRCTDLRSVADCAAVDSIFRYQGNIRRTILRAKFYHRTGGLRWFEQQVADGLQNHLTDWKPDLVVDVPSAPFVLFRRGFNLSTRLADAAAERCGLPRKSCLRRAWFSRRQSTLRDGKQRLANAEKSYTLRPGVDLRGKRVVLIDDILTTGATASACARLLREAGAESVCLLTLCRAPRRRGSTAFLGKTE